MEKKNQSIYILLQLSRNYRSSCPNKALLVLGMASQCLFSTPSASSCSTNAGCASTWPAYNFRQNLFVQLLNTSQRKISDLISLIFVIVSNSIAPSLLYSYLLPLAPNDHQTGSNSKSQEIRHCQNIDAVLCRVLHRRWLDQLVLIVIPTPPHATTIQWITFAPL